MIAVNWADAMSLFKFIANMAGVVLAIAGVQVLLVNIKLLPAELQPPMWRKIGLILGSLFYGVFSTIVIWNQIKSLLR